MSEKFIIVLIYHRHRLLDLSKSDKSLPSKPVFLNRPAMASIILGPYKKKRIYRAILDKRKGLNLRYHLQFKCLCSLSLQKKVNLQKYVEIV